MRYFIVALALSALVLTGCGRIEQNHVGVRTTFTGKVLAEEEQQGFYTALLSSVDEYSTKEITVELFDMQPKASDNLTMADLDIEVYYVPNAAKVADLRLKYSGRDAYDKNLWVWYPAHNLIRSLARNTVYEEVAKHTSLDIHRQREQIASGIKETLQTVLNASDPDTFTITKVVIRSAVTDPSIEESIKVAVARKKELEAKAIELDIARKQVEINRALDASLTPAVLEQRKLDVQMAAIEKGAKVNMIMGNALPIFNVK